MPVAVINRISSSTHWQSERPKRFRYPKPTQKKREINMGGTYDILEKLPDGKFSLVERAENLEQAKMRFFALTELDQLQAIFGVFAIIS
jgi:hypothetical protein